MGMDVQSLGVMAVHSGCVPSKIVRHSEMLSDLEIPSNAYYLINDSTCMRIAICAAQTHTHTLLDGISFFFLQK